MDSTQHKDFWEARWSTSDIPWDHGEPAPPLIEFLHRLAECGLSRSGRVLVPGCGGGHDARLLAEHGFDVTGLDFSTSAVAHARELNRHPRLHFLQGDFLHPSEWLESPFDGLVEHTCLCAMPPHFREAYAASVAAVLRQGAFFFGIFYVRTRDPGGPPFQIDPGQIDTLFAKDFILHESWQPELAFESRMGREQARWYQRR